MFVCVCIVILSRSLYNYAVHMDVARVGCGPKKFTVVAMAPQKCGHDHKNVVALDMCKRQNGLM